MLLHEVVTTSGVVTATRSRKAKVEAISALLAAAEPDEIETLTSYVAGSLRQRRTGLGWRSVGELPEPAAAPSLELLEVHEAFDRIAGLSGCRVPDRAGGRGR